MEKLKLNIQYFSSTNQTVHYDLSQYVANDKPTYLIDYNGDMLKIDNAIYNATSKALENESHIGTMSNLNTTEKSNLVGAINEVNTITGTNTSNISQNTLDISANSTKIGTLADLSTTYKTNLVGAINEVKSQANTNQSNIEKFNMTQFTTPTNPTVTGTGNLTRFAMNCASNSDGSIGKIYGDLRITCKDNNIGGNIIFPTPFRPSQQIEINGGIIAEVSGALVMRSFTIDTDGTCTLHYNGNTGTESRYNFVNSLLFFVDLEIHQIHNKKS